MNRIVLGLALMLVSCLSRGQTPGFGEFDKQAQAGAKLTVVFFGASLTWGANATDPNLTSYRAKVAQRLEAAYPLARFKFYDAAIGGTGSQLGLFRLERDVLSRKPDLVFLDFTANDNIYSDKVDSLASYEAIVRRILTEAKAPVVQVVFPFRGDAEKSSTRGMLRRDAHFAISKAYRTGIGDGVELIQEKLKAGAVTTKQLWPVDGVHPGDAGYELFAEGAWQGFQRAIADARGTGSQSGVDCVVPEKMLYPATYMSSARVRISSLTPLPEGWRVEQPNVVSAYFDMLMSRWLDDETVVSSKKPHQPLKVKFTGTMVMVFGESTPKSGKFRARIDGKLVEHKDGKQTGVRDFDAGRLGVIMKANSHMVEILAEGLDGAQEHTLEIEPVFAAGLEQELRIESICVAGEKAAVKVDAK